MRGWLRGVFAVGLVACLAACGGPPPPPPTVVALSMSADKNVNPDPSGQGAPVVLRVYQLGSASSFNNAEFFDLFNNDQAALKSDLIHRDDVTLAPGASASLTVKPNDQVTAIGLFAGYRNWQQTAWRKVVPLTPHETTTVTVTAGASGLTVKSTSSKPAGGS
jgi:type VI secretion system protein VasD